MSTPVFVDLESSTQADGAQSSRVPVPLPEDPYETIRKAYLVGTDTESEPFEDLGNESPESPHVVASPISFPDSTPPVGHVKELEGSGTSSAGSTLSDSTTPLSPDHPLTRYTPVLVPSLCRTARMVVRVQPVLLPGYSARIVKAASMSDVAYHKRFRSSYESSPSPSPTLLVRKRYRGTSELIFGTDSEGDELGDEEVSLDSDSGSEDAEDEGPAAGDEDPGLDDKGYGLDDKSRGIDDEGHSVERDGLGLEEEDEAVLEGQQQAAPVVETTMGEPLGLGYGALMSTLMFVDPESSTQADVVQSSRVPVPLPEDPYEDIRTESPESPHIVASPISFPDSTPPVGYVEELKGSDTSGAGSTS
ncbi:hypothetical protein Tco_0429233 [Tanacetum coccineum]